MKRLLSKHVQRYAMFALLLLAFLLGSVSTYGFAGMDGQAVMVKAQGEDKTGDVLTGEAQPPVVDPEKPETGEAEKIQEGNAEPAVEGENTGDPTPPPPENNSEPGSEPADSTSSKTEQPNGDEPAEVNDPSKDSDSEPGDLKEADKDKTIIPAEEDEIQVQPESLGPNKSPNPPTNEEDTSFDPSEEVVPEAVRGGTYPFTVTKRPVSNPADPEELVGEYDTFADAIENCKQEDLGNLYIITVNSDHTIPRDEDCYSRSSVHILLRSAEGQHYTLTREGSRMHFIVSKDCDIKIENLTLDGNSDGEFTFLKENGQLTLGADTIVQNFADNPNADGPALYLQDSSTLNIEEGVVIQYNQSETNGGMIKTELYTTLNINRGTFKNNSTSTKNGGAIYSLGKLVINGGTFENNSAKGAGGAIACFGETNISNVQFNQNSSAFGGAIYAYETLNLNNSSFSNNESPFGGALYLCKGGDIEKSTFSNNTAANQGGAIYLKAGDLAFSGSNFTENKAVYGGGALYIHHNGEGNSQVSSCEFTQNASSAFGGGIYLGSNKKLEVISSTFSKNEAAHGGGISTLAGPSDPANSNLSIQSSTFAENVALSGGGVFTAVPTQINQTAFSSNESVVHPQDDKKNPHVTGIGGALYVMDQRTDITASNFSGNTAYGSGGALCISGELKDKDGNVTGVKPAIMVNIGTSTRFEGNNVQVGQGGAIYCAPYEYANVITKAEAYTKLSMENSTLFLKNYSGEGLFNPPSNYAQFKNLGFSSDSDVTHGVLTRKSVLNNYDVNFKNSACLITYIANGGEFVDGSEQQVEEHELDAEIKLAAAPTRSGYRFTGWQAAQTMYQPGDDYTVKGNATFVAQWEAEDTPTLRNPYPRGEISVFTAPASVAPTPVPAAPSPKKIYNLPATGSASPARSIFMGLGLVLVGLLLKKRS